MSSNGFSFPPPPPPPPPSSSSTFVGGNHGYGQQQQRGGWTGSNPRGRGRGGQHQRGGGVRGRGRSHMKNATTHGQRGGYGSSGSRGGFASSNPSQYQNGSTQQGFGQNPMHSAMAAPSYYCGQPTPLQTPYALPTLQQSQNIPGAQLPQQQQPTGFTPYNNQNAHGTNKRPRNNVPRPPAAPAVPSFGVALPLPVKPPPPASSTSQPALKKRKYNQLGLTPKILDPESSEEEDDADEESRLTANMPSGGFKITYRGRTSALQSADDIARWIEERRKRFPTIAKVEEAKKEAEAKKAEREAIRKQKEEARRLAREERDKEKEKQAQKKSNDGTEKARLRAEKLRKKLMKADMKLAKAEAAEKAKLSTAESTPPNDSQARNTVESTADELLSKPTHERDCFVERGLDSLAGSLETKPLSLAGETEQQDVDVDSDPTSSSGPSDDETSSSGSDISSDSSDSDSDSDGAPEEMTSRRTKPDRIPPPPRVDPRKSKICHHFAKTGRCNKGDQCRFAHERPERQPKKPAAAPAKRKSLFQALLSRQREEEDRRVMEVIAWLGDKGLLSDPSQPKPGAASHQRE